LLQLIGTPFLIHAWGLNDFGLWTIVTTIPLLLISMDFGIAAASAGFMIRAISREDTGRANSIFVIGLTSSVAICLLTFILAGSFWLFNSVLPAAPGNASVIRDAIPIALVYVGVSVISGIANAGYRANGFYARGVLIYENGRLIEQLLVILFAVLGGSIQVCLLVMTAIRAISTAVSLGMLVRMTPWIRLRGQPFDAHLFRSMIKPALSAMLVPSTQALSIQGMTFVVGTVVSPASAAIFSTARILSRTLVQATSILTRAAAPEFALGVGEGELAKATKISWTMTLLTFAATAFGGLIIVLFGREIISLWTRSDIKPEIYILVAFCFYGIANALWNNFSGLLTSINAQSAYAPHIFLATAILTALSLPIVKHTGYSGACAFMVAIELACLALVLRAWKIRTEIRLIPKRFNLAVVRR
jgi:O-antigen/teichoic acid export membrane protein